MEKFSKNKKSPIGYLVRVSLSWGALWGDGWSWGARRAAPTPLTPCPLQPFVEIAVKHHNRYEAKKYAPRVTPEQRVKAFVLVG